MSKIIILLCGMLLCINAVKDKGIYKTGNGISRLETAHDEAIMPKALLQQQRHVIHEFLRIHPADHKDYLLRNMIAMPYGEEKEELYHEILRTIHVDELYDRLIAIFEEFFTQMLDNDDIDVKLILKVLRYHSSVEEYSNHLECLQFFQDKDMDKIDIYEFLRRIYIGSMIGENMRLNAIYRAVYIIGIETQSHTVKTKLLTHEDWWFKEVLRLYQSGLIDEARLLKSIRCLYDESKITTNRMNNIEYLSQCQEEYKKHVSGLIQKQYEAFLRDHPVDDVNTPLDIFNADANDYNGETESVLNDLSNFS